MSRSKIIVEDQMVSTDVDFVSRWSKLKYERRQNNEESVNFDDEDNKTSMRISDSDAEQQAAVNVLTDEDMPDIESMTPDSDYTDFFSPGVSQELRNLALRKLFLSEVFNARDGLDDYDGDYTQFEALGDIVTSDVKHQLELKAKREAEQLLLHESPLIDENRLEDVSIEDHTIEEPDVKDSDVIVHDAEADCGNKQDQQIINHDINNENINSNKVADLNEMTSLPAGHESDIAG